MKVRKILYMFSCLLLGIFLTACGGEEVRPIQQLPLDSQEIEVEEAINVSEDHTVTKMFVQVGDTIFSASLESNTAVNEFVQMMQEAPIVMDMSDYSGFEKIGSLGTNLTSNNSQINTEMGDIVLYNGNQIVLFYDSHSWSYTRIGKIDDILGLVEALGNGAVQVTFSIAE